MKRLTNQQVKEWAQFYARLIATNIWNGFAAWLTVAFSGLVVHSTGVASLDSFGWKGALWSLLGTIAVKVGTALKNSPLPEPEPPKPSLD